MNEYYWIELKIMTSSKYHPDKLEVIDEFESEWDNKGFIKEVFEDTKRRLEMEIH